MLGDAFRCGLGRRTERVCGPLDQANGQLARDEAQLANAQVDLNRYQMLITQNSIAQQQVDSQAALVRQDQADFVAAARISLCTTRR